MDKKGMKSTGLGAVPTEQILSLAVVGLGEWPCQSGHLVYPTMSCLKRK
jgi:hypothetical protein